MDLYYDKSDVKDRILEDVGKSIKLVQQFAVCGLEATAVLGNDSWLAQSLCHLLDVALRHGLRDLQRGYWLLVREICHSDTLYIVQTLKRVSSPLGRGRAWLRLTLTEGSLQSYLACLGCDSAALHHHYMAQALLRDEPRMQQLLTLLAGLEHVRFELNPDMAYLDVAALPHSDMTCMTSSVTSSLASPVDSGVALLDSDADATSVSEATINEGDVLSLREEDAAIAELEESHINQFLTHDSDGIGGNLGKDLRKTSVENIDTGNKLLSSLNTSETKNLNAEYTRILKEKVSKDMINSGDINKHFVRGNIYHFTDDHYVCTDTSKKHQKPGRVVESYKTTQPENMCEKNETDSGTSNKLVASRARSLTMDEHNRANQGCDRMSQSCMAYLECRNDVASDFNVEGRGYAVDPLPDNKQLVDNFSVSDSQKQDSNIMSKSTGCDGIVLRRQRKKKRDGSDVKVKRVSFHEDFIMQHKEQTPDFSVSFLPPNSVIKRDVIKGRYSWCAEGDAPFVARRGNENNTKSDVYLSSSTQSSSEEASSDCSTSHVSHACKSASRHLAKEKEKATSIKSETVTSKTPPVTERGTPEGQEDPPKTSSTLHLNSIDDRNTSSNTVISSTTLKKFPSVASSMDWLSDTESDPGEWRTCLIPSSFSKESYLAWKARSGSRRLSAVGLTSKTSLLSRFMRSLTEKKFVQRRVKLLKPASHLYIRGVKPGPGATEQFLCELEAEARLERDVSSDGIGHACSVTLDMEQTFQTQVFQNFSEKLYKVFKVSSSYLVDGKTRPLLALLTDCTLYLVGMQPMQIEYQTLLALPYHELDAIIVGPSSQTALLSSKDRSKQFLVASGDHAVTEQLVCRLEIAMRRMPAKISLPAVRQLTFDDMKMLTRCLRQDGAVFEDEALQHYSLVHVQDNHLSPPTTPLGPTKEGHLMFRPATDWPLQPWEAGYFMLKGGVVYMFGDRGHRLPKRVIPLHAGQCQGCRRLTPQQQQRPHTFEILLGRHRSLQFAAADEYEASDWLQALVQAASGLYEVERVDTLPCSLVVTSRHIVTCREQFPIGNIQILACATIEDITAFSIADAEQSWCVLEFACREVHETSGDWVLYFTSAAEMRGFHQALERLWPQLMQTQFPVHTLVDEVLHHRCVETSQLLAGSWDSLLSEVQHQ